MVLPIRHSYLLNVLQKTVAGVGRFVTSAPKVTSSTLNLVDLTAGQAPPPLPLFLFENTPTICVNVFDVGTAPKTKREPSRKWRHPSQAVEVNINILR